MSSFRCKCGETSRDQTDNLPYKARFITDKNSAWLSNASNTLEKYLQARIQGHKDEFILNHFGPTYPTTTDESTIIFEIISGSIYGLEGILYECDTCGRLYVQHPETTSLLSYSPEHSTRGIFRAEKA